MNIHFVCQCGDLLASSCPTASFFTHGHTYSRKNSPVVNPVPEKISLSRVFNGNRDSHEKFVSLEVVAGQNRLFASSVPVQIFQWAGVAQLLCVDYYYSHYHTYEDDNGDHKARRGKRIIIITTSIAGA